MAADLRKQEAAAAAAVICVQSHFRGYKVRSKLKQVQKEFEEIVRELDGQDFHVVWPSNKKSILFPLVITNDINKENDVSLHDEKSLPDNSDNKPLEDSGSDECGVEDKTLTQDACDKIEDISALHQSTTVNQDEISGIMHDSVRRKLEQNFDESLPCVDEQTIDHVKTISHNRRALPVNIAGECSSKSSVVEDNDQARREIMPTTSASPVDPDKQVYTQHSTPLSSGESEQRDRGTLRKHPLLTDSWMTDKSFDVVSDDAPISNDDLQQKREQIAMELLWTQQAIESRKTYLRLKNDITSVNNDPDT